MKTSSLLNLSLGITVVIMPASALIGAVLDNNRKIRGRDGTWTWVSDSNYDAILTNALAAIVCLACAALIRQRAHNCISREFNQADDDTAYAHSLPLAYTATFSALFGAQLWRGEIKQLLATTVCFLITTAILRYGWTHKLGVITARLLFAVALTTIAYALIVPEKSLLPCRPDKCSPIGGLLTSFFPQENVLAIYFLISPIVAFAYLKGFERCASIVLFLSLIGFTGSRMAILAAVGGLIWACLLAYAPNLRRQIRATIVILIATALVLSVALFFGHKAFGGLTGRSSIYELLQRYWLEQPILGPGRGILAQAYDRGETWNYVVSHEHGQIPFMLVNSGIIGMIAFIFLLIALAKNIRTRTTVPDYTTGFAGLLTLSIAFVTEPVWQFDLGSPAFWTMVAVSAVAFGPRSLINPPQINNHETEIGRNASSINSHH